MKKEEARKAYDALMKFYPLTLDNLDGEEWRDVRGYEGLYQVSNFGRVKSFKWSKPKILKPVISPKGYLAVTLVIGGEFKGRRIHRLVAEAFVDNLDNKPAVNHIDGHPFNNHISNLEWVTNAENSHHAVKQGLFPRNPLATLSDEQVVYIRENPDNLTSIELCKKFNVLPSTISSIQMGRLYRSAGGKIRTESLKPKPRPILKISVEQREEIRRVFIKGDLQFGARALAKKYGVSHQTILHIVHEGDDNTA